MRLTSVKAFRVSVPIIRGYQMATQDISGTRETVLVHIRAENGVEGWGEAPGLPNWPLGMTPAEIESVLNSELSPRLEGRRTEELNTCLDELAVLMPHAPFAVAGIDLALHDLVARTQGVPVWKLLGARTRHQVPVHYSLGIAPADETVRQARQALAEGFYMFKCKVGREDRDEEVRVLAALRKALGPTVRLRADANGAWAPAEAIRQIKALERVAALEFLEQPVPGPDLEGLDEVARKVTVPIMADESVATLADIEAVARLGSVPFVNLKVAQLGGLRAACRADRLCSRLGLRTMIGMVAEVGPARTARLHLAAVATSATLGTPTGVSAAEHVGGASEEVRSGKLDVPDGPGLGSAVAPAVIARLRG